MGSLYNNIILYLQYNYVKAGLTLVAAILIANLIHLLLGKILKRILKKKKKHHIDQFIKKIDGPLNIAIFFVGLLMALRLLNITSFTILKTIETIITFPLTYVVMIIADTIILEWSDKWKERTKSEYEDEILPLLRSFSKIFIALISLIIMLNIWNVKITALLASLGIAGLAISFALKDSLANVFGGISLVLDNAFSTGDAIKLETGEVGRIINLGLRSTKLETFDGELIIIPNNTLANSRIINYAKPNDTLRIVIPVSVAYGSQPEKVKEVLLESLKSVKETMKKSPPEVRFIKMSDFSLDFELIFFIHDYRKRFTVQSRVTELIYEHLTKAGIHIPFPTRTLYLNQVGKSELPQEVEKKKVEKKMIKAEKEQIAEEKKLKAAKKKKSKKVSRKLRKKKQ